VKFDIGDIYENLSWKSNVGYNQTKIWDVYMEAEVPFIINGEIKSQ
jgi:hypothetical protein